MPTEVRDHGYTGYCYGCRCEVCTEGNRVHQQQYKLKVLRTGKQRVPVQLARDIIYTMTKIYGMRYRDISIATGLSMDTLYGVNKTATKYINKSTYDKLVAAEDIGAWRVDSEWCKQLERALMRMGWSQQWVALQVGYIANGKRDGRGRGPWHQYAATKREYVLKLLRVYINYRNKMGPYDGSRAYAERKGYLHPIDLDAKLENDKTLAQLYRFVKLDQAS